MAEGIVVDLLPVAVDEGGNKQEQSAPGLVEIGDDAADDLERIARGNDDLRGSDEGVEPVAIEVVENVLQSFRRAQAVVLLLVGHPLADHESACGGFGLCGKRYADVIQALEGTDGGGAHGYDVALVPHNMLYGAAADGDILRVHLMPSDGLALHGLERPCPYVQRQLLAGKATAIKLRQHLGGEVKPCRRRGNGAFHLRIDSLICLEVALLGLAVEVRGDGQLACRVEHFGKAASAAPSEAYHMCLAMALCPLGSEHDLSASDVYLAGENRLFPFLRVPDEAYPAARLCLKEDALIVVRLLRVETEHLYACPRRAPEQQPCLYDAGIVEHHECPLRQVVRDVFENALAHRPAAVEQQLGFVSVRERELGYPFVGQRIAVVVDVYLLCLDVH